MKWLTQRFGTQANSDQNERKVYSKPVSVFTLLEEQGLAQRIVALGNCWYVSASSDKVTHPQTKSLILRWSTPSDDFCIYIAVYRKKTGNSEAWQASASTFGRVGGHTPTFTRVSGLSWYIPRGCVQVFDPSNGGCCHYRSCPWLSFSASNSCQVIGPLFLRKKASGFKW